MYLDVSQRGERLSLYGCEKIREDASSVLRFLEALVLSENSLVRRPRRSHAGSEEGSYDLQNQSKKDAD